MDITTGALASWLKKSGATGLDDLQLADFPETGRGLQARRHFDDGGKILTIPHGVLWTVKHAHADPILGPALLSARPPLSIDDTLAIYILYVRSRDSEYEGPKSHVAALPTGYTSSIFFSELELSICAGSSLYTTTKQLTQQIETDYADLETRLFERNQGIFPRGKFTIEDYKWALCTVWSRAMDFSLQDGGSIRLLAPFADMLNHSSNVRQCHVYDPSSGNLSILAGKGYEKGDQVFINYGPVANNRLSRLYGFVMPDNPHDSYDLVLATHPMAPLFEQKQRLWASAGLDSNSTIALTLSEPLPNRVLQYLRIQRLDGKNVAAMGSRPKDAASKMISVSNEVEILTFLVESFSTLLDGFAIQMDMLEEQLTEDLYAVGENSWSAAHVSLGEQRVLRSARKKAESLLATVESEGVTKRDSSSPPAQCANCGKSDVQLMRCGRCNGVSYCGRTCQVAHYKQHKASCQATTAKN